MDSLPAEIEFQIVKYLDFDSLQIFCKIDKNRYFKYDQYLIQKFKRKIVNFVRQYYMTEYKEDVDKIHNFGISLYVNHSEIFKKTIMNLEDTDKLRIMTDINLFNRNFFIYTWRNFKDFENFNI